ncbi:hypothetical protein [uncultured Luteimonas sp.]|uniref:hypothetical protein n=1 Tax=uncultured Luteimonas sp. TaxID=453144 RepID=UPI002623E657|nr:hypothetical protein [uncultured Luteimonas sp.]
MTGLAIGWASPPPPLPKQAPATDDWTLPEDPVPSRALAAETRNALQAVRWDGEESGTGAEGPWRLAGVATGPVALIEMLTERKIMRLERGATLGDATLLQIGHDRIRIERGGCELVYQLYRSEPVSAEGDNCPEPQAAEDAAAAKPSARNTRTRARRR